MKYNSLAWIDSLDRQLLFFREKIEKLIFKKDMGLSVDIRKIAQGYEKQRKLLIDPTLLAKIKTYKETNPLTRRKLELIKQKIIEAKTVNHPQLLYSETNFQQEVLHFFSQKGTSLTQRAEIMKKSNNRGKRKEYFSLMGLFLDSQENNLREMVVLANRLAREANFPSFSEAKFFSEEISTQNIMMMLKKAKQETDGIWKKILKEIQKAAGIKNLEMYDLYYGINQLSNQNEFLPKDKFFSSLKTTTGALGISLEKLPIKITNVINAPPAGVYALGLPKKCFEREITIAIDQGAGWNAYAFLFHEFGHAIYYAFSPSSFLLTDSHLSREIMAEMWVGFLELPEWFLLNGFTRNKKQAQNIIESKLIWDIFQVRSQLLEAEFELAVYSNPPCDFKKVWRKLCWDILGIQDTLGVYSEFVFLHPLDIKDYILAWETKKQFVSFLQRKFGKIFGNSKVANFLISKLYIPGAILPWKEKLAIFE